ncbi:hypothetical protein IV38_GL001023 [Lactobacillus selangorensis]|uniref:WYL domain-containing protein n=1 Tax=Lactobacillus selangorensis TaxID=81857 RepID=A0A0R2G3L6_9LACO|nr:WYL domain-containing protein [Lactobacillus selangorensis]KRN28817.1 hypothetical protein IV38_GL001023 [Lactobacillus selangorensis]KRN32773.1 hypothetical protein IV40_GL000831 [Lactobacillus selangorensis]
MMNAAQRELFIYTRLLDGQSLRKRELADHFEVSPRAIQRDISQLNLFFEDEHLPYTIFYDAERGGYRLQSDQHELNQEEILVMIKVLFASRVLNQTELNQTITGLLNLIHSDARKQIEPLIKNEQFHYQPLQHHADLLDRLWALSQYVLQKQALVITYRRRDKILVKAHVLPEALFFSEFYFYLISYNPAEKGLRYYRVDRLLTYKPSAAPIQRDYKDRFEAGAFREYSQFMYPGAPITIQFQFWGIVEAALDRLPTAKVIRRYLPDGTSEAITAANRNVQPDEGGSVVITAQVNGLRGITMWLLSQGSNVKVLAPTQLIEAIKKEASNILNRY